MKRTLLIGVLVAAGLFGNPARASADLTFFLGLNTTPESRSVRGVAAGVNLLIVGFEFEYANTVENPGKLLPGLMTGMFNVVVMTPTSVSLYATAGGGAFRETLGDSHITNWGTNIGGGVKFPLFGPLKVRVDYRIFNLRGNPHYTRPQRLYAGINWAF
ncbi:MAG TPA: hypothetical protein VFV78_04120 [Vicinamibacterales bacterium]|nr:hypothetical protein [Vicinamibacterales bacterium]